MRDLEPAERAALLSGAARQAMGALGLASGVAVSDALPVLHGLYWLTVNVTATRPLLVAVDDAHWADGLSLRYLDYLARRVVELPVLVVVASRPAEPHGGPDLLVRIATEASSHIIQPSPLTEDAVGRLVERHLDGPADREFVRACHDATGGIPFLVHHLLAALSEDKAVSSAEFAPAVFTTAPDTVARATRTRLASLPAEGARLAEAVAVLGDDTQLVMVAALAETDASLAATASDQLAAVGVLRPSRPLAFAHPLLRSVVYSSIPTARRSVQHRRAAGLLADAGGPPDRVAAQLLATEPAGDMWVAATLRAGATAALATGDPATAGTFLHRALAEPAPPELRPPIRARCCRATVAIPPARSTISARPTSSRATRVSGRRSFAC
ncbi:MAG TPA: hypothetical protein VE623_01025 [Acidimicrobiales bacterium]|nr:hypothetical protein [Acidimicrobiales bacterium]